MADRHLLFALPGDPETRTGGYGYDRRIAAELAGLGWTVEIVPLGAGFPFPTAAERTDAERRLGAAPTGSVVMVDGLALGAMPEEAARIAAGRRLVALVHHPLALETGLDPATAAALVVSERAALASAAAVVVTSPATAATLSADYGVDAARLSVAVPGTDPVAFAKGSGGPGVAMLSVGSLVPRKGHLDLVAALAGLADRDWRLSIVGSPQLDPGHAEALRAAIAAAGLEDRITLVGGVPPERLAAIYAGADLFVLASHYEGYGMAYAEAIGYGLPVVGTTGGAIPGTVGGAAVLVPPGDVEALRVALGALIVDPDRRAAQAAAARAAAGHLPSWQAAAAIVAQALGGSA